MHKVPFIHAFDCGIRGGPQWTHGKTLARPQNRRRECFHSIGRLIARTIDVRSNRRLEIPLNILFLNPKSNLLLFY